jgi:hypothetical protein
MAKYVEIRIEKTAESLRLEAGRLKAKGRGALRLRSILLMAGFEDLYA